MAGKHVETFALKLGKKCPKNGNILWGPGNGCACLVGVGKCM